jgi:hypothetical protein
MAISIYDAFVPSCRQIITASLGQLAKAEAHCAEHNVDASELIGGRLAPDMAALPFQVFSVAHHSAGAIEGVETGKFSPASPSGQQSWDSLRAMLTEADAALAAVDAAALEGFAGKPVVFSFGTMEMPFTAENFLLSFSQPNFYFHATTLYDILRHKGVKLGKRDFTGMPRIGL